MATFLLVILAAVYGFVVFLWGCGLGLIADICAMIVTMLAEMVFALKHPTRILVPTILVFNGFVWEFANPNHLPWALQLAFVVGMLCASIGLLLLWKSATR